jgi:hypothetical protein
MILQNLTRITSVVNLAQFRFVDGQEGHSMLSRFVFLLLLAATSSALGGQASLGDVSVNLPAPAGFCDLSDTDPSDRRMLLNSRGGGERRRQQAPKHIRGLQTAHRLALGPA